MKILFLGSSKFSRIILQKLIDSNIKISGVITQPDKPSGRGYKMTPTEVKKCALENSLKVYTFDKLRLHLDEVKNIDYDLAVVASYGQILPDEFLNHRLTINVHPSLLPKYRGAAPIQSAILNGDKVTGVTIMKVAKEVDAGDIILQEEYPLNDEYKNQLEENLANLGGVLLIKAIKQIEEGSVTFTPQDDNQATKVAKINKEDGRLDFSKSAGEIINRVRALAEDVGCYIVLEDRIIKIGTVKDASDQFQNIEQNKIFASKKNFIIGCKRGAVEILTCQSPSGKMVNGRDYLNGHREIIGKSVL